MGRSGRRTLLIDGDMRNPSAHRLLEMPLEDGLAEVLRGEVTSESVIRPSQMAGLRFMSAGHCDHMSLQALTKENLGENFSQAPGGIRFYHRRLRACPVGRRSIAAWAAM